MFISEALPFSVYDYQTFLDNVQSMLLFVAIMNSFFVFCLSTEESVLLNRKTNIYKHSLQYVLLA